MSTNSSNPQVSKSPMLSTKNRTWLPILIGILSGYLVWGILAALDSLTHYQLVGSVFGIIPPGEHKATPFYFWVLRIFLLIMAAIGGFAGMRFSSWPYPKSGFLLFWLLVVTAIFAVMG